ncbi:hypothetical protein JMN23_20475 [Bacillus sp. RHFB]|nr:hypothetical protein [Bacillus sp. RHFB]
MNSGNLLVSLANLLVNSGDLLVSLANLLVINKYGNQLRPADLEVQLRNCLRSGRHF